MYVNSIGYFGIELHWIEYICLWRWEGQPHNFFCCLLRSLNSKVSAFSLLEVTNQDMLYGVTFLMFMTQKAEKAGTTISKQVLCHAKSRICWVALGWERISSDCKLIRAYSLLGIKKKRTWYKDTKLKTYELASGFCQILSERSTGTFPVTCHDMFKTH